MANPQNPALINQLEDLPLPTTNWDALTDEVVMPVAAEELDTPIVSEGEQDLSHESLPQAR